MLVATTKGTLLAIAEARRVSCSDFAPTDLVLKRSGDGGKTWGEIEMIRTETRHGGGTSVPGEVIGNAAPVQLASGRILIPHTWNNSQVWITSSDDDGKTWSTARQVENVVLDDWVWVATGPPGSIQLRKSGRIIVPCYHGNVTRGNLFNNIVHGHVMISDDEGETWHLNRNPEYFGSGDKASNEAQAVELSNGTILINARSLANPFMNQYRIQVSSHDGGETWTETRFVHELPQPIDGCEGSFVAGSGALYFSGPQSKLLRERECYLLCT